MYFERTSISAQPESKIKEALDNFTQEKILTPELLFKNSYVLDFLDLPSGYSEEELVALSSAVIKKLEGLKGVTVCKDAFNLLEKAHFP